VCPDHDEGTGVHQLRLDQGRSGDTDPSTPHGGHVRLRRPSAGRDLVVKLVGLAIAVCLAAVTVAGCGASSSAPHRDGDAARAGGTSHTGQVPATEGPTSFGVQRTWTNGLAITISPPKSLRPSETAFPRSPRAAVFEVVIDNDTTDPYKPSQLFVQATSAGQTVQEIQDPAQGLNGVAGVAQDLPPGKTLKLTLGFAVPDERVPMRLVVQPDASSPRVTAIYSGAA
jgi:hypothetical protein